MKDLFPGYYSLNQEQFKKLWANCTFVLDTNILLNLYRYNETTRDEFITKILNKIRERLWIPHQVALEFQENRLEIIKEQKNQLNTIKDKWSIHKNSFLGEIRKFYAIEPENLIEAIHKSFLEYLQSKDSIISKQIKSDEDDKIREIVDEIFKDKIGCPPTKEDLDLIYNKGAERYKISYPPGFKDKGKSQGNDYLYKEMSFKREYGDLIIWEELLKEINSRGLKEIIFITDDNKEDWWHKESGENIGPRRELIQEMHEAGVSLFYMYNSENFIRYAQEYLSFNISENSKKEIEDVAELNRNTDIITTAQEVVQGFSRWLRSQYPDESITPSDNRLDPSIDILRNSNKGKGKIAYEIKYRSHREISIDELDFYLTRLVSFILTNKVDLAYLVLVFYSFPTNASALAFKAEKIIQNYELSDKLGFIFGIMVCDKSGREDVKHIFNPIMINDIYRDTEQYFTSFSDH